MFWERLAGKFLAHKLNLQEGTVETKKWYQSKTIWASVIGGLIGIYGAISSIHPLPAVPEWVLTLLASMGIYGLRTADTKIG